MFCFYDIELFPLSVIIMTREWWDFSQLRIDLARDE